MTDPFLSPPQPPSPPVVRPPLDYATPHAATGPRIPPLALASLVMGILSLPLMFVYGCGIILAIFGLIWGSLAFEETRRDPARILGMALAISGLALNALILLLFFTGVLLLLLSH